MDATYGSCAALGGAGASLLLVQMAEAISQVSSTSLRLYLRDQSKVDSPSLRIFR